MDALWDFSFKKFLTPKIIGFLYGLSIIFAALTSIGFAGMGFLGIFPGPISLLAAPILFVAYVIAFRIALEGLVAIVLIAEESLEISRHTKRTADNTGRITGTGPLRRRS